MQTTSQLTPECASSGFHDVAQLENGHSDEAVVAREAVVFGADVQLVTLEIWFFVAEYTTHQRACIQFVVNRPSFLESLEVGPRRNKKMNFVDVDAFPMACCDLDL